MLIRPPARVATPWVVTKRNKINVIAICAVAFPVFAFGLKYLAALYLILWICLGGQ